MHAPSSFFAYVKNELTENRIVGRTLIPLRKNEQRRNESDGRKCGQGKSKDNLREDHMT